MQIYSTLQNAGIGTFLYDNVPAIKLYQKYGFVKTGEAKVTDQQGQQRAAVLMEFQPAAADHD